MIEEMKDIKDYEGLYAITRDGKVWSYKSKKFLKPIINKYGYHYVNLYKDKKQKHYLIHRLVAEAFIPNPKGLPQVNHKDENKSNNCVNNLEWCDAKYNNNYGTHNERISKSVYCVELDRVFKSGKEAARELGLDNGNICACCRGKRKTAGGYHFRYAETSVEEVLN